MGGLYAVLSKIQSRSGMYIGKPSITVLRHFLVGYEFARSELGIESTDEEIDFYDHFHPWIEKRFGVRTAKSWADIILLFTRDEKEAFDYFFNLLDEFKHRDKSLDKDETKVIYTGSEHNI
jgi:hypothetical protein